MRKFFESVLRVILRRKLICTECLFGLIVAVAGLIVVVLRGCGAGGDVVPDAGMKGVVNEAGKVIDDYVGRDAGEFLETVPDVRGAIDKGVDAIERKRNEVLQRIGGGGVRP
jgi:hypothetical protein